MRYNMSSFCALAGINEHTLRAWERRYQVVSPTRSEGNRRFYSETDLEKVRMLVRLVAEGHGISQIGSMTLAQLKAYVAKLENVRFEDARMSEVFSVEGMELTQNSYNQFVTSCIENLGSGNSFVVRASLRKARTELPLKSFLLDFVPALMHRVGELVFEEKFAIWQEHILSAALRAELSLVEMDIRIVNSAASFKQGAVFVFATLEGNLHELGIMVAWLLAANAGFETHYIGAHLPFNQFAMAVKHLGASHAVLGAKDVPPGEEAQDVAVYVKSLKELLPKKQCIWVGGSFARFRQESLEVLSGVKVFQSLSQFQTALDKI